MWLTRERTSAHKNLFQNLLKNCLANLNQIYMYITSVISKLLEKIIRKQVYLHLLTIYTLYSAHEMSQLGFLKSVSVIY